MHGAATECRITKATNGMVYSQRQGDSWRGFEQISIMFKNHWRVGCIGSRLHYKVKPKIIRSPTFSTFRFIPSNLFKSNIPKTYKPISTHWQHQGKMEACWCLLRNHSGWDVLLAAPWHLQQSCHQIGIVVCFLKALGCPWSNTVCWVKMGQLLR